MKHKIDIDKSRFLLIYELSKCVLKILLSNLDPVSKFNFIEGLHKYMNTKLRFYNYGKISKKSSDQ